MNGKFVVVNLRVQQCILFWGSVGSCCFSLMGHAGDTRTVGFSWRRSEYTLRNVEPNRHFSEPTLPHKIMFTRTWLYPEFTIIYNLFLACHSLMFLGFVVSWFRFVCMGTQCETIALCQLILMFFFCFFSSTKRWTIFSAWV